MPDQPPHHCHARSCTRRVPPKMLMCAPHWRMVPTGLQRAVWRTYVPGQEITKTPTRTYLAAADAAIRAVAAAEQMSRSARCWRGDTSAAGLERAVDAGQLTADDAATVARFAAYLQDAGVPGEGLSREVLERHAELLELTPEDIDRLRPTTTQPGPNPD